MQDYLLKGIYIYPIKSLGAISLTNSETTENGIMHDRRWMLIDEHHRFMSIRNNPEFLFFKVGFSKDSFKISHHESSLELPLSIHNGEEVRCQIWDDEVEAIQCNPEINQWFSERIGTQCSLVYMPDESERKIKPDWGGTEVSFSDGYPLLVAGEAALRDLNNKMNEPVEMMRFRPNLVFAGGHPYSEFNWGKFSVGNVKFQGLKPCTRCIVTTYDPHTAVKGKEPLLTLSRQKINNNIVFGQHAKSVEFGDIKVGDTIEVSDFKSQPYAEIPELSH